MTETIEIGFQAFVGANAVGAVRAVDRQRKELVVYIENFGETTVAAAAIESVHDEKVMLRASGLEPAVRKALGHAHDVEDR